MPGDIELTVKLDYSAVHFASEQELLLLASLVASEMDGQTDRAPVDLVAVLDRCEQVAAGFRLSGLRQKLLTVKRPTH